MNRLYVVESTPTITGAVADHRYRVPASAIEGIAREIARAVRRPEALPPEQGAAGPSGWTETIVRDLLAHRGRCVVLAGPYQIPGSTPPSIDINSALGNAGRTVFYTEPVPYRPTGEMDSLRALLGAMEAGDVETLLIAGSNPVYTAPADVEFARLLGRVNLTVHAGLYEDETSALCDWHIPGTHYLEEWSDARAFDGTVTIVQPLIAPLYDGKSLHEVVAALAGRLFRERI